MSKTENTFVMTIRLDIKTSASLILYLEENKVGLMNRSNVIKTSIEILHKLILNKYPHLCIDSISEAIEIIKASGLYDPLDMKNKNFRSLTKELELEDSIEFKPARDSKIRLQAEKSLAEAIVEQVNTPSIVNIRKELKGVPDILEEK